MALLITCSFCPGEYVLFETAPRAPRDMRACVHRYACMRACECTRMLRTDHVFLLSRRLRSLRNRAAAARRRRNLPRPRSRRGCGPCRPSLLLLLLRCCPLSLPLRCSLGRARRPPPAEGRPAPLGRPADGPGRAAVRRRWRSGAACPCRRWLGGRCLNESIAMQTPVPARSCMQFEPPEPRSKSNRMNIAYDIVCPWNVVANRNIRYHTRYRTSTSSI